MDLYRCNSSKFKLLLHYMGFWLLLKVLLNWNKSASEIHLNDFTCYPICIQYASQYRISYRNISRYSFARRYSPLITRSKIMISMIFSLLRTGNIWLLRQPQACIRVYEYHNAYAKTIMLPTYPSLKPSSRKWQTKTFLSMALQSE